MTPLQIPNTTTIPSWVRYIAKDPNGHVYGFSSMPKKAAFWMVDDGPHGKGYEYLWLDDGRMGDWSDSLHVRRAGGSFSPSRRVVVK